MAQDCLFCKIISKEIIAEIVYEDSATVAFKDISPQSLGHLLFIHKIHSKNVSEMINNNPNHLLDIFNSINKFTSQNKFTQNGYRIVTNHGKYGGQTVFHTHFHLLFGEQLGSFGK